jgi:hypothetical protein
MNYINIIIKALKINNIKKILFILKIINIKKDDNN